MEATIQTIERNTSQPSLYVGIELTHCNLGCAYCYEASLHEYHLKDNLNFADTAACLLNLERSKTVKYVGFTGGEPTLHPQIDTLTYISKLFGFQTHLSTNAMFLFRKDSNATPLIEKLRISLDVIAVSIDGPNEQINDTIRALFGTNKTSGQFSHVMRFFEWYRDQLSITKKTPSLKVNTIVIQSNKDSIMKIGELLIEIFPPHVVQWKLEEFIPRGRGRLNKGLAVSREEVAEIVKQSRERFGHHLQIAHREYEDGKPYPFLLIIANGLVTIPQGELHPAIEVSGQKINMYESNSAELLREWVNQNPWFVSGNENINSYRRYTKVENTIN